MNYPVPNNIRLTLLEALDYYADDKAEIHKADGDEEAGWDLQPVLASVDRARVWLETQNETEYFVQWFNPNDGWCDLEGADSEEAAYKAAHRFIKQDQILGVEKPRYRVVVLRTTEIDVEVSA